jgi:hypothetical protein
MKGVRFYEEYNSPADKRKGKSTGNVIAVFFENPNNAHSYEGLASLIDQPNGPVCSTIVGYGYLRTQCKRIPERKAREIHPAMFERLDSED